MPSSRCWTWKAWTWWSPLEASEDYHTADHGEHLEDDAWWSSSWAIADRNTYGEDTRLGGGSMAVVVQDGSATTRPGTNRRDPCKWRSPSA